MVDYATLAEIRSYGRFDRADSGNDTLLEDLVTRVSRMIDKQTGYTFAPDADSTEYFQHDWHPALGGGRDLFLGMKQNPLLSVSSITNGDGTSISTDDVFLLPRGADRFHTVRLKEASAADWETDTDEWIAITGRWGYSLTVPDDIKQAAIEAVLHIFHNRTDPQTERAQVSADGFVMTPADLPSRTRSIIQRYQKKV